MKLVQKLALLSNYRLRQEALSYMPTNSEQKALPQLRPPFLRRHVWISVYPKVPFCP